MSSILSPEGSIESRLHWLLGGLLVLMLAVLLVLGLRLTWLGSLQFVATRLAHDGEAMLSAIDPHRQRLHSPLPPIYRQPLSGHYLLVRFADGGELRSRSLWDETLDPPSPALGEEQTRHLAGPSGQRLLLWSAGYEKDGLAFSLHVAEDISSLHLHFRQLLLYGLLLALAMVALLLLAQGWLLRRLFQRLDRLRGQLAEVSGGQRQQLDAPVPSEIQPLVAEFNQLLGRLQAHLVRSRLAAGNLAHALKGPLQRIAHQGRKLGHEGLQQQAEQMHHLIERELHRARLAGSAMAGRHFVAQHDLADLVEGIQALYADRQLHLDWRCQCAEQLPLDQDDMMELLGNLLDNAAKWARQRIRLRLEQDAQGLLICLEDDGPGLNASQCQALLQRGKRLDEQTPGQGLGLAIVKDIVESYNGQLQMDRSTELGGLRSRIRLRL
ncbi:sensor histidine kinase [Magnetovirga frankeli]|uniref:sensor histidine kinase n=1 Tax=Magnetovirga frankeli TaxID=947516 RepID=UPI001293024C|nr:sensor histidine kinase [gamma proteobacterium SS-5]